MDNANEEIEEFFRQNEHSLYTTKQQRTYTTARAYFNYIKDRSRYTIAGNENAFRRFVKRLKKEGEPKPYKHPATSKFFKIEQK